MERTGCPADPGHTATLLPDGTVVVIVGGSDDGEAEAAPAEVYDPATGAFNLTATAAIPRFLR